MDRIYDGCTFQFGVDTDTDPSALDPPTCAKAVNRIFRGGRNRTRPPFVHFPFVFEETPEEYQQLIRFGNFQGWMNYEKSKPGREDGAVVSVAGKIFFLTFVNEKVLVRLIFDGNDPKLLHTWFVQAEEWCYIQNGKDLPIFWDGLLPTTARRADPAANEMPIGTIMAYAHGRVFVSNSYNQIVASDIIHGNGFTRTDATQKFTENKYPAEGGFFAQPTMIGDIAGMVVVPRMDQRVNGQGELIAVSVNGASSYEVSKPRITWKDADIQSMTLLGRGCSAPASLIVVNNDIWFRSDDGMTSYGLSRADERQKLSFTKISRAANEWFSQDTEWLIRYASMIYFDNRILCTVSPFLGQPANESLGTHHYHRGIVALDLDQPSGVTGDGAFNFDGLWTGIRPCGLVKVGKQAFAFSYEIDGENRIYEIKRGIGNDQIDGKSVRTQWSYVTKRFDWFASGHTNLFEVKKLIGGEMWVSDARDLVTLKVEHRPDNIQCWYELMKEREFGSSFGEQFLFSQPRYERFKFQTPNDTCERGAPYGIAHGTQHQIRVSGSGYLRVDRIRMAVTAKNDPNSPQGTCDPNNPKIAIECNDYSDYSYSIANFR